jgi:hypothetical protein
VRAGIAVGDAPPVNRRLDVPPLQVKETTQDTDF